MFFKKKDTELEIINRFCFKKLHYIERNLIDMGKNLNEVNINRNYDKIMVDIDILINQMDIITGFEITKEILERKNELSNMLDEIFDKIIQIGIEIKKEILNKVDIIDTFDKSNDEIKEILEWIWDRLKLHYIEIN